MQLKDIRALVAGDLAAVDTEIRRQLASDVALVNQVGDYIVGGGGKRLRPLLVVLAARAAGAKDSIHIPAAALIEFIHTATLLHDDVVDDSARRRGRETANHAFGNPASVLVGDFLYSRAFQMMATLDSAAVIRVMADATNTIAAGEVLQLMNSGDPDTTEIRYMEVIYRKTARLFEAGAQIAAIVARAPAGVEARSHATASTSASRSSSSTTRSTTAAMPTSSARTSAMTSPRASRRCRSSTRSRTATRSPPRSSAMRSRLAASRNRARSAPSLKARAASTTRPASPKKKRSTRKKRWRTCPPPPIAMRLPRLPATRSAAAADCARL